MNAQKGFIVPLIIVVIAILAIGGGAYVYTHNSNKLADTSAVSTDSTNISGWKSYQLKGTSGTLSLQYPTSFNADGTTGIDGSGFEVDVKNFVWHKDAYSFDYIKPLTDEKFYMQVRTLGNTKKLSLTDWVDETITATYNSPEKVQVIDEYKDIYGEVIGQVQKTIGGNTAIQRTVLYPSANGSIKITYTYVNEGSMVFQFINHNNATANIDTYNKILSTFKFTK